MSAVVILKTCYSVANGMQDSYVKRRTIIIYKND